MTDLEKLFNEILLQLKEESIKYKKLKICKYSFEISKVAILSLATGLSFLNIFAILSIILIPVIDTTKHTANVDQRLSMCKLKKDLLKELCLGSCQLSRGFEESGNQSNKQISATFRKIIFHFQAKVKSTRHC